MNRPTLPALCVALIFSTLAFSQVKNPPGMKLAIKKAKNPIVLDGLLDETDWKEADLATNFFLNYPVDTAMAEFQSEARLTYDDHALYVSFVCYDDKTKDIIQSMRRDFDFDVNDNMGVFLGPYNDGINGFYFVVTPLGVQLEGTISAAGADDNSYNSTWDNKWYSKTTKYDDRWVAELMIPFKSFRYKSDVDEWNITFLRYDLKRNRTSSWIATPIQFIPASFAFGGKLLWVDKPPKHSKNISLIPYLAGGFSQDEKGTTTLTKNVGMDAKFGVTPSLNLDVTVNPDFSQVEVDAQVINLTRFEFQFPERRQFFLENNDLFERMGFPEARTFFSRRIGLARDSTGTLVKVPILYGLRLSGSLSKKWRLSVLNMQTQTKPSIGLPSQNFTVAAIQRNFWKQSNIQFSIVNKQSLGVNANNRNKFYSKDLWREKWNGTDTVTVLHKYNRVGAIDIESRSADNKWYTSLFYSHSLDNLSSSKNNTGGGYVSYTKRNYQLFAGSSLIQENFNAESGYVPTKGVYPGVFNTFLGASGTFYPKNKAVSKIIVNHGPVLNVTLAHLPVGIRTDKAINAGYQINFQSTAALIANYNSIFQRLTNSFNPINAEDYISYQKGAKYDWTNIDFTYVSDQRKVFQYTLGSTLGGFYNGNNSNFNGQLNFRYQPYGSLSVKFDYNDLRLPTGYGREKLFIVSPRMDLTFTKKLFLTTFVQYNTLLDNMLLNARFQWRYRPASDFFVVYTENYGTQGLTSRNRALILKLTYWLNI